MIGRKKKEELDPVALAQQQHQALPAERLWPAGRRTSSRARPPAIRSQ